jgi:hypothetical protein
MTIGKILLVIAVVLFVLGGFGVAVASLNLLMWGLAFFAASFLL